MLVLSCFSASMSPLAADGQMLPIWSFSGVVRADEKTGHSGLALMCLQTFLGLQTDAEAAALVAAGAQPGNQQPDSEFSRRLAGKYNPRSARMRVLYPADGGGS